MNRIFALNSHLMAIKKGQAADAVGRKYIFTHMNIADNKIQNAMR